MALAVVPGAPAQEASRPPDMAGQLVLPFGVEPALRRETFITAPCNEAALAFLQQHGRIHSLGFRLGPVAYSSDVSGMPEESFSVLEGVECWILDALRYAPLDRTELQRTWVN